MFLRHLGFFLLFLSFCLAIHIIAHLFNFERYHTSQQAKDGSLASVLSGLSHHEKYGGSWLNPFQSPNMVSWFSGKVSGIWSWARKSWYPSCALYQVDISPFTDCVVCDIHQHCWSHWSDWNSSLDSHGNFSYGVYSKALFWALLVYTSPFYRLFPLLSTSWLWVRSSNSYSHAPAAKHCIILYPKLSFLLFQKNCPGSNEG